LHTGADTENGFVVPQESFDDSALDLKPLRKRGLRSLARKIPVVGIREPATDAKQTLELFDNYANDFRQIGNAEWQPPSVANCLEVALRCFVPAGIAACVLVEDYRYPWLVPHLIPSRTRAAP
jgi:hypothetical protein